MTQKKIKIAVSYLLCIVMLCACGRKEISSDKIELLDPVSATSNTEKVAYRDLFNYRLYSGFVLPYVEEYAFAKNATMKSFAAFYGQEVKKGDVLVYADAEKLEESIEALQDKIDDLLENYEEKIDTLDERRKEIEEEMAWPLQVQVLQQGIENPQLSRQIDLYNKQLEKIDLQKKQAKETYDLEKKHYDTQMKELKAEKKEQTIVSKIDGTIVASNNYESGQTIREGDAVVAVANESQKLFRCTYMSAKTIASMQDIYAIVNGKRYEVTYIPYENSEYNKLEAKGESVYSIFEIVDENEEVKVGDFLELVMIVKEVDHVLSVPKASIHKDEKGSYVYVVENNVSTRKDITLGYSDGIYSEVLAGLSENEDILLNDFNNYGSTTYMVTRGDYSTDFEMGSYVSYQQYNVIRNPVKNGVVHMVEFLVPSFTIVHKGDVIAKIWVEKDEVQDTQRQMKLQRLTERLADLENDTEHLKENAKNIANKKEQLEKLKEEIAAAEKDYTVTEITSEYDGLILNRPYFEKDEELPYYSPITYIAKTDESFLDVDNEGGILSLNDEVTIEYTTNSNEKAFTTGKVVSVSPIALSSYFTSTSVKVKINEEAIDDIMFIGSENEYSWGRIRMNVTAKARCMNNILLVPVKAVTEKDGQTYVNVIDDNGNITARSFIAGGYDKEYYWVAQGLEEGMKLCSK